MDDHLVITLVGGYGRTVESCAKTLVEAANKYNLAAQMEFNQTVLYANPGETADEVHERWDRERKERSDVLTLWLAGLGEAALSAEEALETAWLAGGHHPALRRQPYESIVDDLRDRLQDLAKRSGCSLRGK